ncbi:hypothetical protein tinsulaeT_25290 [Thalassotalea insulae]|uniref:DUF6575 domain-containing protein n=1 Tax=Thalassotalea insulae TaxID=2056778 RepID=A0ABQ6GV06_9GAMM|nr:DUF6575 domain-containing protein [Thalassotalea insulae]GLX79189.1 hypothetical protein tinsulaeT_25290 [Thalassotalea insulae]
MSVLPNTPYFGKLEISHVYEYYEGPRLFNATNGAGNNYIAFWIDTDNESDHWLYSSISEEKLELLNSAKIKLRDIYTYPEDILFRVRTFFNPNMHSEIVALSPNQVTEEILPPSDFYLEKSDTGQETFEVKSLENISELYVRGSTNKTKPTLGAVAKVSDAFSNLYKSILKKLDYTPSPLIPVDARTGSFIIRLKSPKIKECIPIISQVFKILNENDDPFPALNEIGADIGAIENLLEEVIDGKVRIQFSQEDLFEAELNISEEKARSALSTLKDQSSSLISSALVPQANDLYKVFKVVELKSKGDFITPQSIDLTTDRQVAYYLHAARMLGLLAKNNSIQSVGYQFEKLSKDQKMNIASIRFESSECGWAWLKWANKKTLEELDPDTATQFLIEQCPSLSKDTAERRAKTLKKWQIELAKFRFQSKEKQ